MKPTLVSARKSVSRMPSGRSAWKAAEDYGIDMALLASNLKRTPIERMRRHDAALNACLALRQGALIAAKQAMNRPKDLESLLQLGAIKKQRSRRQ